MKSIDEIITESEDSGSPAECILFDEYRVSALMTPTQITATYQPGQTIKVPSLAMVMPSQCNMLDDKALETFDTGVGHSKPRPATTASSGFQAL